MSLPFPQSLSRQAITDRLPHAGAMALLDAVASCDGDGIHCRSLIPTGAGHPLALRGVVGASALIEYAAQAAALHSALLAESEEDSAAASRGGFVVAVRDVHFSLDRLTGEQAQLDIEAHCLARSAGGISYRFHVAVNGSEACTGRLTVATHQ